jgi:SAM-dependent methyltransferase
MDLRVSPKNIEKKPSDYVLHFVKTQHGNLYRHLRVLDLGSGRWRHANFFSRLGIKDVTCIDIFERPNKPQNIFFLQRDLENGIALNSKFDVILATYLFMFIHNIDFLVSEIDRVSNAGAFLICQLNIKTMGFSKRPLSFGRRIDPDYLIKIFQIFGDWVVLHQRSDAFILQKGGGLI